MKSKRKRKRCHLKQEADKVRMRTFFYVLVAFTLTRHGLPVQDGVDGKVYEWDTGEQQPTEDAELLKSVANTYTIPDPRVKNLGGKLTRLGQRLLTAFMATPTVMYGDVHKLQFHGLFHRGDAQFPMQDGASPPCLNFHEVDLLRYDIASDYAHAVSPPRAGDDHCGSAADALSPVGKFVMLRCATLMIGGTRSSGATHRRRWMVATDGTSAFSVNIICLAPRSIKSERIF